jgi:hypothetical protein
LLLKVTGWPVLSPQEMDDGLAFYMLRIDQYWIINFSIFLGINIAYRAPSLTLFELRME